MVDPHMHRYTTFLNVKGHLWHKSSIRKKGVVSYPGIDEDATTR